jgi:hypothetical protein
MGHAATGAAVPVAQTVRGIARGNMLPFTRTALRKSCVIQFSSNLNLYETPLRNVSKVSSFIERKPSEIIEKLSPCFTINFSNE